MLAKALHLIHWLTVTTTRMIPMFFLSVQALYPFKILPGPNSYLLWHTFVSIVCGLKLWTLEHGNFLEDEAKIDSFIDTKKAPQLHRSSILFESMVCDLAFSAYFVTFVVNGHNVSVLLDTSVPWSVGFGMFLMNVRVFSFVHSPCPSFLLRLFGFFLFFFTSSWIVCFKR